MDFPSSCAGVSGNGDIPVYPNNGYCRENDETLLINNLGIDGVLCFFTQNLFYHIPFTDIFIDDEPLVFYIHFPRGNTLEYIRENPHGFHI